MIESLEIILWKDNVIASAWRDKEDFFKDIPVLCETIGWVGQETEEAIWLYSSRGVKDYSQVSNATIIIQTDILKRTQLASVSEEELDNKSEIE